MGTDTRKGLTHSVVVTYAAVHDSQAIDGEAQAVNCNKVYASEEKKKGYQARGVKWCVNRKAKRGHHLSGEYLKRNHKQSQIRAKNETTFLGVKHPWHYQKVRYEGLYKNSAQVFSLFVSANLYLVRYDLRITRAQSVSNRKNNPKGEEKSAIE